MIAISRSRHRPAAGLLVGMSLVLAACGGAAEEGSDVGAAPADVTPIAEGEPAPDEPADPEEPAEPIEPAEPADEPVTTPEPTMPESETATTTRSAPEGADDCSASGHSVEVVTADDLPGEVQALRDLLIDAALSCDEQLLYTAMEESDGFNFTFGSETDALGMWWALEEAGDAPFLRIAQVLATTPALADGGELYVWPRVTTGRPEDTTDEAWQEVTWVDDIEAAAELGDGYLDWRAGISTDGQWRFFVRGD